VLSHGCYKERVHVVCEDTLQEERVTMEGEEFVRKKRRAGAPREVALANRKGDSS